MKAISDVKMSQIIQRLRADSVLPKASFTVQTREDLDGILSTILDNMQAGSVYTIYIQDPNAALGLTKDYTITIYKKSGNPIPDFIGSVDMATMLIDGWYSFYNLGGTNLNANGWQFYGPHKILDSGNTSGGLTLVHDTGPVDVTFHGFPAANLILVTVLSGARIHTVTLDWLALGNEKDADGATLTDQIYLPFEKVYLAVRKGSDSCTMEIIDVEGGSASIQRIVGYN